MRTKILLVAVLTFFTACSIKQKTTEENIKIDTAFSQQQASLTLDPQQTSLKDTTVNGVELKFFEVSKRKSDSLTAFTVETKITLEKFDHLVSRAKNCQLIKLANGIDSLCEVHDESGYFKKFEIKGLWKDKGQLLANFQDWEGGGEYLINLKNGFHYRLNTVYEVSPSRKFILGYNPDNVILIYGNDFMYSEIQKDSIRTYFNIDFGQAVIINLKWLNDSQCLVSSATQFLDSDTFKLKDYMYHIMTIKK